MVWDQSGALARERAQIRLNGQAPAAPTARAVLPTRWNVERSLLAVRWPISDGAGRLELVDSDGAALCAADLPGGDRPEDLDISVLLAGLAAEGRLRLARFLLDTCRTAFKIGLDKAFTAAVRDLLDQLSHEPGPLHPRLRLPGGALLCATAFPLAAGRIVSALAVAEGRVVDLPVKPEPEAARAKQGRAPLHLVLPRLPGNAARLVLIGDNGLLIRRVATEVSLPADAFAWLAGKPSEAERAMAMRYLQDRMAGGDEAAGALAREIGLFAPAPAIAITDPAMPVGAEIELAVDDTTGHAFLTGWMRDPLGLVARLDVGGAASAVVRHFPRPDLAERLKLRGAADQRAVTGFAVRLPGSVHLADIGLGLRSGSRLRLRPALRALSAARARDAVLGAVPADAAGEDLLREIMLPAAQALNAAHLATRRAPETVAFGAPPAAPRVSVVVPLYRNLDFLPFQLAAFALDPEMRDAELIYVLDSPEQRLEAEGVLRHLSALYGCAARLVVMSGNFGYAAANNAGAAAARGEVLALLNSDVVPERAAWLQALLAPLDDAAIGAVGARLLFDDGSLQHAGLYWAADDRGAWRNRHFFKGMPRDFAPATRSRRVPAVTGACLAIRRSTYERLGGFDESYVVGDYEDSDLCLKLDAAGLACFYEPRATLLHLERQSVPLHGAHARGLASECNRVLHASRWQGAMEAVMRRHAGGEAAPAAQPPAAAPEPAAAPTMPAPSRHELRSRRKGRK